MVSLQPKVRLGLILNHRQGRATNSKERTAVYIEQRINDIRLVENNGGHFDKTKSITLDRYLLFHREQKNGESVKQYYNILTEFAEKCNFRYCEEKMFCDICITNNSDINTK